MPDVNGIHVDLVDGELMMCRIPGYNGLGQVDYTLSRRQSGCAVSVISNLFVVGFEPTAHAVPFYSSGDTYELRINVDLAGNVTVVL